MYQALGEPIGLVLRTSDRTKARQALYQARQHRADPALAVLQIRFSPVPDGDLVVVKGLAEGQVAVEKQVDEGTV